MASGRSHPRSWSSWTWPLLHSASLLGGQLALPTSVGASGVLLAVVGSRGALAARSIRDDARARTTARRARGVGGAALSVRGATGALSRRADAAARGGGASTRLSRRFLARGSRLPRALLAALSPARDERARAARVAAGVSPRGDHAGRSTICGARARSVGRELRVLRRGARVSVLRPDERVPGSTVLGACHRGDRRAYLAELDRMRGRSRAWVLFGHELPRLRERELMVRYLDAIGQRARQRRIERQGRGWQRRAASGCTLYDLSDSTRLSASARIDVSNRASGAARAEVRVRSCGRVARRRTCYGQGGIRTHGTREGPPVFKTGAFNRSATCPGDDGVYHTRK